MTISQCHAIIQGGNFDNNNVSLRARALKSFGSMINVSPYKFD